MSAVAPFEQSPAIPNATGPDPAVMEAVERGNAVVFLDVALGDGAGAPILGRIKLELFVKDVCSRILDHGCESRVSVNLSHFLLYPLSQCPKTCENFRQVRNGHPCIADTLLLKYFFVIVVFLTCDFHTFISSVQANSCEMNNRAAIRDRYFIVSSR